MPSVFLLFTGIFCQLFVSDWADWSKGKWFQVAMGIGLTWLVVAVGSMKLDLGKWVNNAGAVFKTLIILALGIGGIVAATSDGAANTITFGRRAAVVRRREDVPAGDHLHDARLRADLIAVRGDQAAGAHHPPDALHRRRHPRVPLRLRDDRDPLALPLKDLGLVEGLVDTFKQIFGTTGFGNVLVYVLGIAAMYTFFTNMTTWSMGANRSAQEAAAGGELPALLAREHPVRRTPVAAYVVSGLVATAVLLFAAIFVKSQDDLFYAIFSASAVVFLMPYLLMFPAAWTLRRKDPDTERPYRVPGGDAVARRALHRSPP